MPRFKGQIANFSAGELSPGAQDRIDDAVWQAGAEHLENVLVRRGGGVRTRPGLRTAEVEGGAVPVPIAEEFELFAPGPGFQYFEGGIFDPSLPNLYDPAAQGWRDPDRAEEVHFGADGEVNYVRPGRPNEPYGPLPWRVDPRIANSAVTEQVDGAVPSDGHLPQCRYMKALWQINPRRITGGARAWPISTLVMKALRLVPQFEDPARMTWIRFKAGMAPAGYVAGKYYPKFALVASIEGNPRSVLYSLTGLGPYDTLSPPFTAMRAPTQAERDAALIGNALWVNTTTELSERRVRLRHGLTGTRLAAMNAACWLTPDGGTVADVAEAVAWSRILLVELASEIADRDILEDGGLAAGTVQWFMGGLSARYSTTAETRLQGNPNTIDRVKAQTSGTQGEAAPPTEDQVRLVEWRPAPGLDYLAMFHAGGVRLTRVTEAGKPLRLEGDVRQNFSQVPLQEMVFTEAPGAIYCFHETLDPPVVLRRKEDGTFAFEFLVFDGIPAEATVPYWGGESGGVRAGVFAYGRLGLIGSTKFPNMLAFSTINDFQDFVPGTDPALDKAFHAITAGTENLHGAILGRRLVLFGQRAEYFLSSEELSARKLDFSATSAHGSPRGGRAVVVDDAIVFRQQGPDGPNDLRMMIFSDEESGFRTPSLAPFSPHLVEGITAYAYQPSAEDGGARLWCVRSDGTMSVLSVDRAAQVNAWSRVTPPEGVTVFEVAVIANRVFALADVFGTPTLMELSYSDTTGSVLDLATVVDDWTQGATLEFPPETARVVGDTCWVVSDRQPPFEADVVSGVVQFREGTPDLAGARVEAGLRVEWSIRTLPVLIRSASGTAVSAQKTRLVRAMVDFEVDAPEEELALALLRVLEEERLSPARKEWPRRIEIEDSAGLWIPFVTLPSADSETLVQCKLGSRRGWKRRTTLALRGHTPCTIVGLSYMVAGSA